MSGWFVRRKRADAGGGVGGFDAGHRWAGEAALRQRLLAAHARSAAADYGGGPLKPPGFTGWIPDNLQAGDPALRASRLRAAHARARYLDYGGAPFVPGTLAANLVSFWEMEELSGTRADALGVVPLTEHGSVGRATGRIAFAADFNGASANFLNADGSLTPLNDAANKQFELSVWVNMASASNRTVFDLSSSTANRNISVTYTTTGNFFRVWSRGVQIDCSTFGTAATSTWILIHLYDDGTNAGVLINNGSGQTATRGVGSAGTCSAMRIGIDNASNGGNTPWAGQIDQVGLWLGRSLTTAQRSYIYNAGAGRSYADISTAVV